MKQSKIVIVGSGVAGINAATKLIKDGTNGQNITIIDAGKDPYNRPKNEVMKGFAGAGLFSDGKWAYLHNAVGGQLAKYTGEVEADNLLNESWSYIEEFHPEPSKIMFSNPIDEPDFIKPYFNLRMAPTYHIGTNYLHDLGKTWYDYLVDKGVNFIWEHEVYDIDFDNNIVLYKDYISTTSKVLHFNKLIYGTGKSGIDLTQKLIDKYNLK
jgi:uncharacterized FAD-dependent dehydrogenase